MRICFTSDQANGLESVMSYHFGHCPYFVLVDVEGSQVVNVESIPNPFADEHNAGDLPSFMHSKGVNVIITGGMGPKAQQYFADYGITPVIGAYGKIKDVLEEYLKSKVEVAKPAEPSVSEQHSEPENEENKEVERLKKEVTALREQIADLKSLLKSLEDKLG